MKAKTIRSIRAWAMFGPDGLFHYWTVSDTKSSVIDRVHRNYSERWPHYYRRGYRVRRILITVED